MADGVYTEAGGRGKISDGQWGEGSDGTGSRAALSRSFKSFTLAGAVEHKSQRRARHLATTAR